MGMLELQILSPFKSVRIDYNKLHSLLTTKEKLRKMSMRVTMRKSRTMPRKLSSSSTSIRLTCSDWRECPPLEEST